jgi:hypothetical protein
VTVSRSSAAYEALGKVFIAGTGRSGTSILHNIVGGHPDAFKVPGESKFIVEGDGLRALVAALGDPCAVSSADLALNRFIAWTEALGERAENGIERLGYFHTIGRDWYFPPLRAFVDRLIAFREGPDYVFPRLFENRDELIALTREMVSAMFGAPAVAAGKRLWVEKTPNNLLAMDFVWELFPEACVIHIKRDPRAVLKSFMEQPWLPGDRERCATVLADIYAGWRHLKPRLDLAGRRYLEIRLEDLISSPRQMLGRIARLLGVENEFSGDGLHADRIDTWRTNMAADDREFAERVLAPYFALMGYEAGEGREAAPRAVHQVDGD